MKKHILALSIYALILLLLLPSATAWDPPPRIIDYRGIAYIDLGKPAPDGSVVSIWANNGELKMDEVTLQYGNGYYTGLRLVWDDPHTLTDEGITYDETTLERITFKINGHDIELPHFTTVSSSNAGATYVLDLHRISPEAPPPGPPARPEPGKMGGIGGGGASVLPVERESEISLPRVEAGERRVLVIPDPVETVVRRAVIIATELAEDVVFVTRDLVEKPATIPSPPPARVYTYFDIEVKNLMDAKLESAEIHFRLEKSWLDKENIDPDTITLHRYQNGWTALETTFVSEESKYMHYKAKTPGFSVFAITGSVKESKMHLVHLDTVSMYPGETRLLSITVENIGDTILQALTFSASGDPIEFSVSPATIPELASGSKAVFLLDLKAPDNIDPGEYTILISVGASETFIESSISVSVPSALKPAVSVRLANEIEDLQATITDVWEEAEWQALRGANVSESFDLLQDAREKLDTAARTLGMVSYDETKLYLYEARSSLEDAVNILAKEQPKFRITVFPTKYVLIFVAVMILVLGIAHKTLSKYERIMKAYEKAAKKELSKEYGKLKRQLHLIEEGHRLGYIEHEAHMKAKKRLHDMMKKLKSKRKSKTS